MTKESYPVESEANEPSPEPKLSASDILIEIQKKNNEIFIELMEKRIAYLTSDVNYKSSNGYNDTRRAVEELAAAVLAFKSLTEGPRTITWIQES